MGHPNKAELVVLTPLDRFLYQKFEKCFIELGCIFRPLKEAIQFQLGKPPFVMLYYQNTLSICCFLTSLYSIDFVSLANLIIPGRMASSENTPPLERSIGPQTSHHCASIV